MTRRSFALALILTAYSTVTVIVALIVAALAAHAAGAEMLLVFVTVFAILCISAGIAGGWVMDASARVWDQHWDAEGISWAVSEAEMILRAGSSSTELPPPS